MKIGSYLPSAILISVSLMIGGLSEYVNAGWEQTDGQWSRRSRPILPTLTLMVVTHAAGSAFFLSLSDTSRVVSGSPMC
jgi:glycosylphosphatidylinositol transamidase